MGVLPGNSDDVNKSDIETCLKLNIDAQVCKCYHGNPGAMTYHKNTCCCTFCQGMKILQISQRQYFHA